MDWPLIFVPMHSSVNWKKHLYQKGMTTYIKYGLKNYHHSAMCGPNQFQFFNRIEIDRMRACCGCNCLCILNAETPNTTSFHNKSFHHRWPMHTQCKSRGKCRWKNNSIIISDGISQEKMWCNVYEHFSYWRMEFAIKGVLLTPFLLTTDTKGIYIYIYIYIARWTIMSS